MAGTPFDVSALLVPGIGAAALVIGKIIDRGQKRFSARETIINDLEIHKALPSESTSKEPLLEDIDRRVGELVGQSTKTRDASGIVLGLLFMAFGIWMGYLGWTNENGILKAVFWVAAVVAFSLGAFGLAQDASKYERDAKGRPVQK